jgi:crotonobetainyl-CoA:carnitine CoA-transferase CaiB-like acyl-CoA transferase
VNQDKDRALADLRVVDLATAMGAYCTRLLGGMGADVIRIEAPDGDQMRRMSPLVRGRDGRAYSLSHLHYNTNKRSLALDVQSPEGSSLLKRMLQTADVLVDCFRPEEAARLDLTYDRLRALNPRLIHTSITGFGLTGPHAAWKANDLVGQAVAGVMVLTGFPEDPPARMPFLQAYHQASLHGAVATMSAVVARDRTGEGTEVEVSMQDAMALTTIQSANLNTWTRMGVVPSRLGTGSVARRYDSDGRQLRQPGERRLYRCQDGWMIFSVRPINWPELVEWLTDMGSVEDLGDADYRDQAEQQRRMDHIIGVIERSFLTRTREYLYHEGQRRGLLIVPVQDAAEMLSDEQLRDRGFFVEVEQPELGRSLTHIGAPAMLSETPWLLIRRAPALGEHSREVLMGELGLSDAEFTRLVQTKVVAEPEGVGVR